MHLSSLLVDFHHQIKKGLVRAGEREDEANEKSASDDEIFDRTKHGNDDDESEEEDSDDDDEDIDAVCFGNEVLAFII